MEAAIGKARGHMGRFLDGVVVGKFTEGREVKPVILFMVDKDAEIRFKRYSTLQMNTLNEQLYIIHYSVATSP
jgi:hypothetical protein